MSIANISKRKCTLFACVGLICWAGYLMGSWLIPFVVALILAYALHVPTLFISRRLCVSSTMAAVIMVSAVVLLLSFFAVFLIPLLKNAGIAIIQRLPRLLHTLPNTINSFLDGILPASGSGRPIDVGLGLQGYIDGLTTAWPRYLSNFIDTGMTLVHVVVFILTVPVVTFYLLRDWEQLEATVKKILRKLVPGSVIEVIADLNVKLAAYVQGQLLICIVLSICYGVGLYFIGITEYIVCGLFSGFLSVAPFFGPFIGFVMTLAMAIDDYTSMLQYILTCSLYAIIPLIDSNILTSRLIGKSTGIHPVWLLFSICATAAILGACGIFISVPVAVVLSTICKAAFRKFSTS